MATSDSTDPTGYCARCRRQVPSETSGDFCLWEAGDPDGATIICPGCLTAEELTAMAEDFTEVGDEITRRQGWGDL